MATDTQSIPDNATNHGIYVFYNELLHDTELHTCVADYLISRCVLTIDDAREIKCPPGQFQRNKILLDILIDRPYNSFYYLVDALEESGSLCLDLVLRMRQNKTYIKTDTETEQDSFRSDLREHSVRLQKNYKSLVEGMGSSLHIVDKLFSEDVIDREEKEQIMATEITATDRNRLIIEKLIPKNKICYRTFLEVLRDDDCDSALADEIEQTDVSQTDILFIMIGRDKLNDRIKDSEKVKYLQEKVQRLEIDINESIPKNVKAHICRILQSWETDNMQFLSTRASTKVMECLQSNKCVTVLGNPGVGKTVTTQYAALEMQKMGYEVIPVTVPKDIRDFHSTGRRTIFVIDDLCGNYTANYQSIEEWKLWLRDIQTVLEDEYCKIIATCRLQVFKDTKMAELPLFRTCVCNLNADDLCLTLDEKVLLADVYFGDHSKKAVTMAETCDFFPLMCKLYKRNKTNLDFNLDDFLKHPFSVFENELNSLFVGGDEGDKEITSWILEYDNDCNKSRPNGESPLLIASYMNLLPIVQLLINHGAAINQSKKNNVSPLFMASQAGHIAVVDLLLSYNANVDVCRSDGQTALGVAAMHGHCSIAKRLIDKGADVNKSSNIGMTPLHNACHEGHLETVRLLIENGSDVNICSKTNSPLYTACYIRHVSIVNALISAGADLNKSILNGFTPLYIACNTAAVELVNALIDNGASANTYTQSGYTPLYVAICSGNIDIVNKLIEGGADVNIGVKGGASPLYKACHNKNSFISNTLIDKGADVTLCLEHEHCHTL
ncbi:unnamed protein product [Mytilus edulis]|uniref:CARD domain-containing protein n=1 Tax=Mytilus edulis TaxID=6550 RepID=A0A8S3VBE4_MYTED|nr:unnamed protein product [Mytilus edulis]